MNFLAFITGYFYALYLLSTLGNHRAQALLPRKHLRSAT
jgi:hypothetical protein